MSQLHAIPTNVITGFLGAGKTTAILDLLKQKPADERWAILVNDGDDGKYPATDFRTGVIGFTIGLGC